MLKLIMVLLWMILLEVLLCAEAENVTEVRGQLGSEVTLTCSGQSSEPHWYMEIHSQLRAFIGRSFSSAGSAYSFPEFETIFSIRGNRLMIKNMTAEDCRLYYCGIKRNDNIRFVETFQLVSNVTMPTNSPQNCITSQLIIIICGSVTASILLIISFVSILLCCRRKNCSKQDDDLIHIYDVPEAVQQKVIRSQPERRN